MPLHFINIIFKHDIQKKIRPRVKPDTVYLHGVKFISILTLNAVEHPLRKFSFFPHFIFEKWVFDKKVNSFISILMFCKSKQNKIYFFKSKKEAKLKSYKYPAY